MTPAPQNAPAPLLAMLGKYKLHIEDVLPKHMTPQRFMKTIVTAVNKTPQLLQCTPMSVINCVISAAQMGLEIGPGQCYLIPYKATCTLIVDYRAKIDLAIRSGKVLDIDLEIVYSKEKFRIYRDDQGIKRIEHEPLLFKTDASGDHLPITERDRGVAIGAYAFAVLKDGPPRITFMPFIDIDAIRQRSRAKDDGPWKTDPMEMWKKTVCHRICKTLPSSAEMRLEQENESRVEYEQGPLQIVDPDPSDEVPMISAGEGSIGAAVATASTTAELAGKIGKARTWTVRAETVTEPSVVQSESTTAEPATQPLPVSIAEQRHAGAPAAQRPPMPSTDDAKWRDRIKQTFLKSDKEPFGLEESVFRVYLMQVTGSDSFESITAKNKDQVWSKMEVFKKANEMVAKQSAPVEKTQADIAAEVEDAAGIPGASRKLF